MKIENLKRANDLANILIALDAAIEKATAMINKYTRNSFGHEFSGKDGIYSMYISQYSDGSDSLNLTNCGIGVEVYHFVLSQLQTKREEIISEISKL